MDKEQQQQQQRQPQGESKGFVSLEKKRISFSFSLSGEVIKKLNERFPNKGERSRFAEQVLRQSLGI